MRPEGSAVLFFRKKVEVLDCHCDSVKLYEVDSKASDHLSDLGTLWIHLNGTLA